MAAKPVKGSCEPPPWAPASTWRVGWALVVASSPAVPPALVPPPAGDTPPPAGETVPPAGDTPPPSGDVVPPWGDVVPPWRDTVPPWGVTPPPGVPVGVPVGVAEGVGAPNCVGTPGYCVAAALWSVLAKPLMARLAPPVLSTMPST